MAFGPSSCARRTKEAHSCRQIQAWISVGGVRGDIEPLAKGGALGEFGYLIEIEREKRTV